MLGRQSPRPAVRRDGRGSGRMARRSIVKSLPQGPPTARRDRPSAATCRRQNARVPRPAADQGKGLARLSPQGSLSTTRLRTASSLPGLSTPAQGEEAGQAGGFPLSRRLKPAGRFLAPTSPSVRGVTSAFRLSGGTKDESLTAFGEPRVCRRSDLFQTHKESSPCRRMPPCPARPERPPS